MDIRCDCECWCNAILDGDSAGEIDDGRCYDCQDGFHEGEYSPVLENSGWGSWDDGGLH